jgi:hypothetical protein
VPMLNQAVSGQPSAVGKTTTSRPSQEQLMAQTDNRQPLTDN